MKRILSLIFTMVMVLSLCACADEPKPTAEDLALVEAVLTDAAARKDTILNTPTEIVKSDVFTPGETYTGTAYYVSNKGSDSNNGLSPDKPFATLKYFFRHHPKPGDAIFFERGSTWRAEDITGFLQITEGITYSAYGEGPKPQLYGSPESGTGAEKWTLVHEDGDKKIWQYHKPMSEVASIVLNGKDIVVRDVAWWDGSTYHVIDDDNQATAELYDWKIHLEDMQCFPELPYQNAEIMGEDDTYWESKTDEPRYLGGPNNLRIYIDGNEDGNEVLSKGSLYFRCDDGNPGALYEELEFIYGFMYFDGMSDNTVLDNLCIKYCGGNTCTGPGLMDRHAAEGCVIQNCEFGWMGGAVTGYAMDAVGSENRFLCNMGCYFQQGGAIATNGSNISVRNNYIHHAFQEAVSMETFEGGPTISGSRVSGNLIEACGASLMLLNWDEHIDMNHIFSDCVMEDNMVLFNGEDTWFNDTDWLETETAFGTKPGPCPHDGTVQIRNNVFAFTEHSNGLVYVCRYNPDYAKIYSNNTYIQYYGQRTFDFRSATEGETIVNHMNHDFIAQWLGDTTPTTAQVYREDVFALRERMGY